MKVLGLILWQEVFARLIIVGSCFLGRSPICTTMALKSLGSFLSESYMSHAELCGKHFPTVKGPFGWMWFVREPLNRLQSDINSRTFGE